MVAQGRVSVSVRRLPTVADSPAVGTQDCWSMSLSAQCPLLFAHLNSGLG